jgi:hypothetical protein
MPYMRPLIVIGATPVIRQALEPYAEVGHIMFHPTAEAAHYALVDAVAAGELEAPEPNMTNPEEPRWVAHVAYGPDYYGPLVAAHSSGTTRLPHDGHTLVLGWELDYESRRRPIRVLTGTPTAQPEDTTPWHVMAAISADYTVDLKQDTGLPFLVRYLAWKDAPTEGSH